MRTHGNNRPSLGKILDCWNRGSDTSVIRDGFAIEGHVEIAAHEDFFALEVGGWKVGDGFFGAHCCEIR